MLEESARAHKNKIQTVLPMAGGLICVAVSAYIFHRLVNAADTCAPQSTPQSPDEREIL